MSLNLSKILNDRFGCNSDRPSTPLVQLYVQATADEGDDDDADDAEVEVEVFSEYVPRGMTRGVQHPAEVRQ